MLGFNKYVVYGVIAAIAIAILSTYVIMWKANIRKQALLEFNNKQLEQTIKDQQKFIADMKAISDKQKLALDTIQKENEALQTKLQDVENYLNSPETQAADRAASEILKRTMKELSGKP